MLLTYPLSTKSLRVLVMTTILVAILIATIVSSFVFPSETLAATKWFSGQHVGAGVAGQIFFQGTHKLAAQGFFN
ncbi:hypothetical protein KDA_76320 [Dictyobacter alpinus]|uniref:Uncharacterized protein n=1 Tax=Dictyobacter alpinus TaxID=2014873 RepID=A0A402BLA7_9CHLR|nr:hypothetical protein [Dictyobacter alpinus]GCE32148.1 hypothetical protein KDA_76320 [Dictyobacter alpinus]